MKANDVKQKTKTEVATEKNTILPNNILPNVHYILEDIDLDLFLGIDEANDYVKFGIHKPSEDDCCACYSDVNHKIKKGNSVSIFFDDPWWTVFMSKNPPPNVVNYFSSKAILKVIPSMKLRLDKEWAKQKIKNLEEEKKTIIKEYELNDE